MDGVYQRAQAELNNPDSPYYLGAPSSIERLRSYMGEIKTNYFGPDAKRYLARRNVDSFELLEKMREKRSQRNWLYAALGITAFLFRGKIPIIGKFLKKI